MTIHFREVTEQEASYNATKALLPFLIEEGTPVYISRDGWTLAVSSSIGGPPTEATKDYRTEDWHTLVEAVMTYTHTTGKFFYSTTIVVPDLGTWWVTMEPCRK